MFCVADEKKTRSESINYANDTSCLLISFLLFAEEIHGKLFVYNYNSLIARSLPLWNCEKSNFNVFFRVAKDCGILIIFRRTPYATAKKKHQSEYSNCK